MILTACALTLLATSAAGRARQAAAVAPFLKDQQPSGCGITHWFNGVTKYHGIKSSGRDRSYSIHTPWNYDKNRKFPVVIGFHGSSSIGLFFEADTKMSESRFSGEKIMVYPNGVDGAWAGANYSSVSVAEDLQFVSDLVNDIRSTYCVDSSRIYATGMSNGGGFVGTLACSAVGSEFAAFAAASGSFYTDNSGPNDGCSLARSPLPMLEIHGGSDESVYYAGGIGEGGIEPAIPDWLSWWAKRNRCTSNRLENSFGNDVHHTTWTCNSVEGVQQHYKIDDMGHCWASTEPNFSQISVGESPTHIQASKIIMAFFDRFRKP